MGKTSSLSKQKYNDKAYTQVSVRLKKDLVADWIARLKQDDISQAQFIRNAIEQYLSTPPE